MQTTGETTQREGGRRVQKGDAVRRPKVLLAASSKADGQKETAQQTEALGVHTGRDLGTLSRLQAYALLTPAFVITTPCRGAGCTRRTAARATWGRAAPPVAVLRLRSVGVGGWGGGREGMLAGAVGEANVASVLKPT